MTDFFNKLPSILILAGLVGIFVTLRVRTKSARLNLWTAAWCLIFVHFLVDIFQTANPVVQHILDSIYYGSLQAAGMFFIASLTSFVEEERRTWTLLGLTVLPVLAYGAASAFSADATQFHILYTCSLGILFFGPAALIAFTCRRLTLGRVIWIPIFSAIGVWTIWRVWLNDPITGFTAILTIGFGLPGILFWRRYRNWSPAVIACVVGFLLWSLVFPAANIVQAYAPNLQIREELWNVPKFFVALGMILMLLEEKSAVLEVANRREHKLNEQLQKFASITSRLLTRVELHSLCSDIAHAITETSTFRRAVILLSTEDKVLTVAGHSGISKEAVERLLKVAPSWRLENIATVCDGATKIGANSYLMSADQVAKYTPLAATDELDSGAYTQRRCRVLLPLQCSQGGYVGCISLDGPHDVSGIVPEEMGKIELLCGDLAVTISNTALHRQLVKSEKLAAIGQLVAGVAHELNNPLASIVGYAELMGDDVVEGPARQKLDKLNREAHRMKRIIENLLRFARQNNLEKKSANLEALLHDVLSLREYHIRNHEVIVSLEIEPHLPQVALDEDQFKQILLNLLNNSIDAMEAVRQKQIRIAASRQGERVFVRFEDTGHGFYDVNRAFDPFYTTKPVGKGTGLGLSICYGIVKEHGGDIYAVNMSPIGARVVLELPVTETLAVAAVS